VERRFSAAWRATAKAHLVGRNQPILISIVDTADKLNALIPVVEAMMDTGVIAVSEVQAVRVQQKAS